MSFKNPYIFFLLLTLIPLGALFLYNLKKKETLLSLFQVKNLQSKQMGAFLALTFLLIVLALAEPNEEEKEASIPKEEIYFLLDTSSSMGVTDTASKATRFEEGVSFINQNLSNKNLKSLILFNETAEVAIPLTFDTPYFQLQLDQLKVEVGRSTNIAEALKALLNTPNSSNKKKAILVSDGENQSKESLIPLIESLKKKGVDLSAKIVGSKEGGVVPGVSFHGEAGYSRANPDVLNPTP